MPKNHWKIIYTYAHYEKKVLASLTKLTCESYLPLYLVKRRWRDRIKVLSKPLFPNYLFVLPSDELKYEILKIPGVVKYVVFDGEVATISAEEITEIRQLTDLQHTLVRKGKVDIEGATIVMLEGSMKGLRGSIIRRLNASFIEVMFESLGHLVTLNIENNMIRIIEHKKTT